MSQPVIELRAVDVVALAQYAVTRTLHAIGDGRRLEPGRDDLGFGRSLDGVLGEAAVADWLGVPYRPQVHEPDTSLGDVAGCQVRATSNRHGKLIVRKSDPAGFPYVLALLAPGRPGGVAVTLAGWLDGAEAKAEEWWQPEDRARGFHQAAFFVPRAELNHVETLRAALGSERLAA